MPFFTCCRPNSRVIRILEKGRSNLIRSGRDSITSAIWQLICYKRVHDVSIAAIDNVDFPVSYLECFGG